MQIQPIQTKRGKRDESVRRARGHHRTWPRIAVAILALGLLGVGPSTAQEPQTQADGSPCQEAGRNMQCTGFGTIEMDARHDVRGEPVRIAAQIQLHTAYADQGARWIMFSVRNPTTEADSPITVSLKGFATSFGNVVTTRVDQERPSELNLWVDVLDAPLDTPILLEFEVGATQRGAYGVEVLVIAFDRVYEPLQVDGRDASLFSSSLLAVNKETASAGGGGNVFDRGQAVPGVGWFVALGTLAVVAAGLYRRRDA